MKIKVYANQLLVGDRVIARLDGTDEDYIVERITLAETRREDREVDLSTVPWYEGGTDFSGHP